MPYGNFIGEKTSLDGHTNSTGENASNEEYRQDYMDPNVYNNVDEIVFNVTWDCNFGEIMQHVHLLDKVNVLY